MPTPRGGDDGDPVVETEAIDQHAGTLPGRYVPRMTVPSIDDIPTPEQLDALFGTLSNWGRWGADDEAEEQVDFLTPERRAAAGALVRTGVTVSLAHDFPVTPSPETPSPAHHHMLASGDARDSNGIPGYEASRDYIGAEVRHGDHPP